MNLVHPKDHGWLPLHSVLAPSALLDQCKVLADTYTFKQALIGFLYQDSNPQPLDHQGVILRFTNMLLST